MDTNDQITQDMTAIASLADTVGATHDELTAALAEKRKRAGLLLDTVRASMPTAAFRAIANRVQVGEEFYSGQHNGEVKTYAAWRGAALAGPGVEREKDRDGGFTGTYTGCTLYLTEEGSWVEVTYAGRFDAWQGARCSWEATLTHHADGVAVLAAGFDVTEIVRTLAALLRQQSNGNAGLRARRIREEAERLDAVEILLRK
jgi:hypothetical protein